MAGSADSKLTLNFFYFLLGDEALAVHSAKVALTHFHKKLIVENEVPKDVLLISEMVHTLKKIKRKQKSRKSIEVTLSKKADWIIPQPKMFSQWQEYMKEFDGDSELVLVLRYILKVPVPVIAKALDVPEGTVLFRIGRGLDTMAHYKGKFQ